MTFSEKYNSQIKTGLLALTSAIALFLAWYGDTPAPEQDSANFFDEEPDAFMEKGVYREYNKAGHLSILFSTGQGVHFPDSEEAVFGSPEVIIYENRTPNWLVNANRGQYFQDEKKLLLTGSVTVIHPREPETATSFATDELVLFTDSRFITTDQPVRITDNPNYSKAIGMSAWLKEKRIELHSHVEGTFYPTSAKIQKK
ncbi:MAG: LPS export ABC transporter periplasmic protein LptC [Gammaproteobacteria bacterium]|nr:MAG: LPS export ABC transporter periplasmic protein LptC [Pseudomonadota bacterium]PIE38203.1 MAG: LPS export ABC transporter periplasmic protein LptC [Gammaproteobacteria bacterium]